MKCCAFHMPSHSKKKKKNPLFYIVVSFPVQNKTKETSRSTKNTSLNRLIVVDLTEKKGKRRLNIPSYLFICFLFLFFFLFSLLLVSVPLSLFCIIISLSPYKPSFCNVLLVLFFLCSVRSLALNLSPFDYPPKHC